MFHFRIVVKHMDKGKHILVRSGTKASCRCITFSEFSLSSVWCKLTQKGYAPQNREEKCDAFLKLSLFSFVSQTVIVIGSVLPADNNDLNDRSAAYKKQQQQQVTKQTGQRLTLSSVHMDLLSCCCFCPSFWAKSLHVGVHSTALTSLLGHELSFLRDMNRTWPRAHITAMEEERPWQQRAAAQLPPSSPLLLGGFLLVLLSVLLVRALLAC